MATRRYWIVVAIVVAFGMFVLPKLACALGRTERFETDSSVPVERLNTFVSEFSVSPCSQSIGRDCNSCSGNQEGRCMGSPAIWNNGISGIGDGMGGGPALGKPRIFKMPNYYGWGHPSRFHYGEPYYVRSVKY